MFIETFSIYICQIKNDFDINVIVLAFTDTDKLFTDYQYGLAELLFCHRIVGNSFATTS